MKNKFLISVILLNMVAICGFSQGRILSSLESNPGARNAGKGNVMLGNTDQMHLYVNPASFLFSQEKVSADFSMEIFPDSEVGRLMQYNVSGGVLLNSKNALFIGTRNMRGYKIPSTATGDGSGYIKPHEWTADLGYAFAVSQHVVVYGTGTYFQSVVDKKAKGWAVSFGAGYQNEVALGSKNSLVTVGIRLMDAGKAVKFGNTGLPYDLPTSVVVGGDWSVDLSEKHQLSYSLSGRYFVPKDQKEFYLGTGVEYTFNKMFSALVGYQYGQESSDRFTFGLGINYSKVRFNIAYGATSEIYGVNTLMCGIGFSL